MLVQDILSDSSVLLNVDVSCGKQLFQHVADVAESHTSIPARTIINALMERERLGSTAIGDGVSIPHARFAELEHPLGYFLRLSAPIDMDAVDDKPIVIVFVLFAPENADSEHLKLLGRIARIIRDESNKNILQTSGDVQQIIEVLTSQDS